MNQFNDNLMDTKIIEERKDKSNDIRDELLNNYNVLCNFNINQINIIMKAINNGLEDIKDYCDPDISATVLKYIYDILNLKYIKNVINYDIDYVIGYILDCEELNGEENISPETILGDKINFIINNYKDKYYPILNNSLDIDTMKKIINTIDTKYHLINEDIMNKLSGNVKVFYLLLIYYNIDISRIDFDLMKFNDKYSYDYFNNLINYLMLIELDNLDDDPHNVSIIKRWLDGYEEALKYIENNSSDLSEEERNSWKDGYSKAMAYNN